MKTKLTLLKNALLAGCVALAFASCSKDDGGAVNYTTAECAGVYSGTLTIRAHGTGANGNWMNGASRDWANTLVTVTAASATQLNYSAAFVATTDVTVGFKFDFTLDFAFAQDVMVYQGDVPFQVDSLKNGAHTYTTYNCAATGHAAPRGAYLWMNQKDSDPKKGGMLKYASWLKQDLPQ